MAVGTPRSAEGWRGGGIKKRSQYWTRVPRLDSSHLLVAVVVALLMFAAPSVRPKGPGNAVQKERNMRGQQAVPFAGEAVKHEEQQQPLMLQNFTEGENQPLEQTIAEGVEKQSLEQEMAEDGEKQSSEQETAKDVWENAPRIDLVCRSFSGGLRPFWGIFFPTYLTFWPIESWTTSGLVVVLDDDSPEDHRVGTILGSLRLLSRIKVMYEAPPPKGTTCSNWRNEGYARQQYSNFYADLYTDADFVAIIDSDSVFITPVVPTDLFEDGKPIVTGFNQKSGWRSDRTKQAIGGRDDIGRFMTKFAFPVIFKSAHLAQMRTDIASNMGVATFEQAFHMICSQGPGTYSQFDIMLNYIWHNKNDEYSWHLADPNSGRFKPITGDKPMASTDVMVREKNVPVALVMFHAGKTGGVIGPPDMYDSLCVGSKNMAGDCEARANKQPMKGSDGELVTAMWSPPNYSWRQTYSDHMRSVSEASSAFVWHREDDTNRIVPGKRRIA